MLVLTTVHEEQSISRPVVKETFVKGQTRQRKGNVTASPRAKVKAKGKGNHNQDQAGSTNEDGQRMLVFFGFKRQRVEFVKIVIMDSTELPSSSTRVFDGNEEPAGTREIFDQSTGEVLFAVGCRDDRPIVDCGSVVSTCPVDYATPAPTEKVHHSENLESESLQHYGIKRNVPSTDRTGTSETDHGEHTRIRHCV